VQRTLERRPDLLEHASLDAQDEAVLRELKRIDKETVR
jgi:tRNA G37 N-methylase TrmD